MSKTDYKLFKQEKNKQNHKHKQRRNKKKRKNRFIYGKELKFYE